MSSLVEIDSVEVLVIIDNELDPMSRYSQPELKVSGQMKDIVGRSLLNPQDRGSATKELRMDNICCGAHGLSLMITAIKGNARRTVLFDTGPEEEGWERNVQRLKADLSPIELIHLSHWHRDHSGGMLRAIRLINEAKAGKSEVQKPVIVDVHPSRPYYRGVMLGEEIVSMEADPTFRELETAGASVERHETTHTVLNDMFLISGEIPRTTPYEIGLRNGICFENDSKRWQKDELILDERFLMCNVKDKGIVMFTGCSHGGVINASRNAVELGNGSIPLYAVIGGYHLADGDASKVHETVQDLKKLDPKILLPGHCSGWRVKFEIENQLPGRLAPCTVGTKFIL